MPKIKGIWNNKGIIALTLAALVVISAIVVLWVASSRKTAVKVEVYPLTPSSFENIDGLTVYLSHADSNGYITVSGVPYCPSYAAVTMTGTQITSVSVTPMSHITDAYMLHANSPINIPVTLTIKTDTGDTYNLPVTVQVDYNFYGLTTFKPAEGNVFFYARTVPPGSGTALDINNANAVFHITVTA